MLSQNSSLQDLLILSFQDSSETLSRSLCDQPVWYAHLLPAWKSKLTAALAETHYSGAKSSLGSQFGLTHMKWMKFFCCFFSLVFFPQHFSISVSVFGLFLLLFFFLSEKDSSSPVVKWLIIIKLTYKIFCNITCVYKSEWQTPRSQIIRSLID